MLLKLLRPLPLSFLWVAGLLTFFCLADYYHIVDFREKESYDLRMRFSATEEPIDDLVIIEIDDKSLEAVGRWPWSRKAHARLIQKLNGYEASAIYYDVLFPGSQDPPGDKTFAEVSREAGTVIIPFHYLSLRPFEAIFPYQALLESSVTAYDNMVMDDDGIVRRFYPVIKIEDEYYPHSAVATLLAVSEGAGRQEDLGALPVTKDKSLLIYFPGDISVYPRVSAVDILEDSDNQFADLLRGRIVLIGQTGLAAQDMRQTPVEILTEGVAVQAAAIYTLLHKRFIRKVPAGVDYFIIFLVSLLVAWLTHSLRPFQAIRAVPALMLFYSLANALLFKTYGLWIKLPLALYAMGFSFVLMLFFKYTESRMRSEFLDREMETAAGIQRALLPQDPINTQELEASFQCRFYEHIGGDLYDWAEIVPGQFGVCVGDVAGKGIPAALYMAKAVNEWRHLAGASLDPADVLMRVNETLSKNQHAGIFLTLNYVIFNTHERRFQFANAGHEPLLHYKHREDRVVVLEGGKAQIPLGIDQGRAYVPEGGFFEKGDVFLLFSDGLREQKNEDGDILGTEGIAQLFKKVAKRPSSEEIMREMTAQIDLFSGKIHPRDDCTVICVRMRS